MSSQTSRLGAAARVALAVAFLLGLPSTVLPCCPVPGHPNLLVCMFSDDGFKVKISNTVTGWFAQTGVRPNGQEVVSGLGISVRPGGTTTWVEANCEDLVFGDVFPPL